MLSKFFILIVFFNLIGKLSFSAGGNKQLKIEFEDNNKSGAILSGTLIVSDNSSELVDFYEIYWGNNPNSPLGSYKPLVKLINKKKNLLIKIFY